MKSLTLLKILLQKKYDNRPYFFGVKKANEEIEALHEAIQELESIEALLQLKNNEIELLKRNNESWNKLIAANFGTH